MKTEERLNNIRKRSKDTLRSGIKERTNEMNPDKKDGGKPAGGSPGKEAKPVSGAPGAAGKDQEKDCHEMDENKAFQEMFELYCKSGLITKEDGKKWLKTAGLMDGVNCSESDFDKAFEEAAKGEEGLDFCGFHGIIEDLCKEKNKVPKEFFDKLVSAGPPIEVKKC
ncbi:hypothetical protein JTE90_005738 [Oedothorax gibbosus]|uniref:Uncharacterized protein n=1 Tax=Oedothorax gibbosus TaxID=931172 RepID=A0AAV6UT02_9ARAC|nr:hypothetical protein JTE90_005738 [Oedothorax gibbosus]